MGSLGTWIVGLIVAAGISLAIRKIYVDRKNGIGCGSGCGCGGCSGCHGHTIDDSH